MAFRDPAWNLALTEPGTWSARFELLKSRILKVVDSLTNEVLTEIVRTSSRETSLDGLPITLVAEINQLLKKEIPAAQACLTRLSTPLRTFAAGGSVQSDPLNFSELSRSLFELSTLIGDCWEDLAEISVLAEMNLFWRTTTESPPLARLTYRANSLAWGDWPLKVSRDSFALAKELWTCGTILDHWPSITDANKGDRFFAWNWDDVYYMGISGPSASRRHKILDLCPPPLGKPITRPPIKGTRPYWLWSYQAILTSAREVLSLLDFHWNELTFPYDENKRREKCDACLLVQFSCRRFILKAAVAPDDEQFWKS